MSWLDTDPVTWTCIVAGYSQDCPDGCGQRITVGQTIITKVTGVWRLFSCVKRDWEEYRGVITGTEAELIVAIKRVSALGGYVVARSWESSRPRDARFHWTEVTP